MGMSKYQLTSTLNRGVSGKYQHDIRLLINSIFWPIIWCQTGLGIYGWKWAEMGTKIISLYRQVIFGCFYHECAIWKNGNLYYPSSTFSLSLSVTSKWKLWKTPELMSLFMVKTLFVSDRAHSGHYPGHNHVKISWKNNIFLALLLVVWGGSD